MSAFKDLTGLQFGKLKVIEQFGINKSGKILWKCLCSCGKETTPTGNNLVSGGSTSCGCSRCDDLTGRTFGRWTVIGRARTRDYTLEPGWKVRCSCGRTSTVRGETLRNGTSKSCGCLRIELSTKRIKESGINEQGNVYGNLTVMELSGRSRSRDRMWLCNCSCGNKTIVSTENLHNGSTRSCGCLARTLSRERKLAHPGIAAYNSVLNGYKYSAKKRGLSFELTSEEFREITSQPCHYCGIEPKQISKTRGRNGEYIYNGIDRVNNSIGYVISNVVPCCKRCNTAKREIAYDDFVTWIDRLVRFRAEGKNYKV